METAPICVIMLVKRVSERARELMKQGCWEDDAWARAAEELISVPYVPASAGVIFTRIIHEVLY